MGDLMKITLFALLLITTSITQAAGPTPGIIQVLKDCEKATGMKKVNWKAGGRPSSSDNKKMKACLREKGVMK